MATLSRRSFIRLLPGMLALASAACADTVRAGLGRAAGGATSAGKLKVAATSSLTSTPKAFSVQTAGGDGTVFAYMAGGKPVVLSDVCTHQGCAVALDAAGTGFRCPCHGGTFDKTGKVTGGPPPRPLATYPATVVGGVVYITG